jgi:hypothetical protein
MTHTPSFDSKLSLLLSLLVLVPCVGLAAEDVPTSSSAKGSTTRMVLTPESSGLPGTSKPAPLRLSDQQPESQRAPEALRILAETGAGLLTGALFTGAGLLTGAIVCGEGIGDRGGIIPCADSAGFGAFVGFALGFPLGVLWGGEVTGGNGRFYGPLLGMVAGLAAGFLSSMALFGNPAGTYVLSVPFIMLGSIAGYEITVRRGPAPQAPRARAVASSRPRIQPMLTVSSRGTLLGLGGSF